MMKRIDKNIYYKKYYRATKASDEILDAIESNQDATDCQEFKEIVSTNHFSDELLNDMVDAEKHQLYFEELENTEKERDIKNLITNIQSLKQRKRSRRIMLSITTAAAAVIAVSFVLFDSSKSENNSKIILTEAQESTIKKPILIFDTGDTVAIDPTKEYQEFLSSDTKIDSALNKYNTVVIPVGYSYQVTLADGTKVTLNAGSRLKYPTVFSGDTREVELEGEAYFDVTKSDKQFIVNSSTSKIEVFGTQFNVRSKQNGDLETVLVEGSIGFKPLNGDLQMITPGTKLSYVSKKNSVVTQNVDPYNYTAWLDNKFVYKEQSLTEVMGDIATWYGIKVSSVRAVDGLTLTLVISRDTQIDDLMRIISLTLNINIIKEKGMEYTIE